MSEITEIQWADSTVNPIMGCGGCELFPPPGEVLTAIDKAVAETGKKINSRAIFKSLVNDRFSKIENPGPEFKNVVNTTNIWHLREPFAAAVQSDHGQEAGEAAELAIRTAITCYAAKLHLNKGVSIVNPTRIPNKGYAPSFESVTQFTGRVAKTAKLPDLLGRVDDENPWKQGLPRMVFVSDMGDALSAKGDFPFLKSDVMPAIQSDDGKRHLWLWLTKRPERMAKFADEIGGFPSNVCAMTTITSSEPENLKRVDQLRQVKAFCRGLSIEPLWERIPPAKLNLTGIDWVIVGGESGSGEETRPFALEWAEELREHCKRKGVAFFFKQFGRNPSRDGKIFKLKDKHGGEWEEWDESLRIREFPSHFHEYRATEKQNRMEPRRSRAPKAKASTQDDPTVTPEEKSEFKRLDKIVRKGVEAFMECGKALIEIQDKKLWRAGAWPTWEDYCLQVAGLSKSYAHRIINATRVALALPGELPIGNSVAPVSESQLRPLLKLAGPEQQGQAWAAAVEKAEGRQPTAADVQEVVFEMLNPEGLPEKAPSRSERRSELVGRIKEVISKRKSWDQVEQLMAELEELI